MEYADEQPSFGRRATHFLDRAEGLYLKILRAAILVIATLMLLYAAYLAVVSIIKMNRSPDSVVEEVASVAPDELVDAELPKRSVVGPGGKPAVDPGQSRYYSSFVKRYYSLYRSKFEPYRQSEDKQLTQAEFDGAFLDTAGRLNSIREGGLNFEADRSDLETLLKTMTEAATKPTTINRLQRYKRARKVPVTTKVERTRTEYVRGWDSGSTACSDWYLTPYGCAVNRPVEVPYTQTVTTMQFPEGTQSHTQIFKAFQDRFYSLLEGRRESNAQSAHAKRQSILEGKIEGGISLWTSLQIVGAFLALMFFFLLIAIERHQRKLAQDVVS